MAAVATELSVRIDAVQAEKERLDLAKQEIIQAQIRNKKAQRLVHRLDECDANISSLLSQAAECLEALVDAAGRSASPSSSRKPAAGESELVVYEARAQEWFATLHDVQLGLRSAAKNLHKAQQAPLSADVSDQGVSGIANAQLGSAGRGHSLSLSSTNGTVTPYSNSSRRGSDSSSKTIAPGMATSLSTDWHAERPRRPTGGAADLPKVGKNDERSLLGQFIGGSVMQMSFSDDVAGESSLSLSALRQQERNWQQLAGALSKTASESGAVGDSGAQQMAADLHLHSTADTRLLRALLRLHMDVVPETQITPLVATRAATP